MDHLLKSLLNLLQYCFCFMVWFFDCKACEILVFWWGINHWTTSLLFLFSKFSIMYYQLLNVIFFSVFGFIDVCVFIWIILKVYYLLLGFSYSFAIIIALFSIINSISWFSDFTLYLLSLSYRIISKKWSQVNLFPCPSLPLHSWFQLLYYHFFYLVMIYNTNILWPYFP